MELIFSVQVEKETLTWHFHIQVIYFSNRETELAKRLRILGTPGTLSFTLQLIQMPIVKCYSLPLYKTFCSRTPSFRWKAGDEDPLLH